MKLGVEQVNPSVQTGLLLSLLAKHGSCGLKKYSIIAIYPIQLGGEIQNNRFIKTRHNRSQGRTAMLRLFNRKKQAVKKWRSRAWIIDPKKTNLTIVVKRKRLSKHVPPWIYKKQFSSQITSSYLSGA